MRSRLLIVVAAILVLATLVASSVAAIPNRAAAPDREASAPQALPAPSGVCLANAQQCNPTIPRAAGPATAILLLGALTVAAVAEPARRRWRRHRRACPLAPGVATVLVPPPRLI